MGELDNRLRVRIRFQGCALNLNSSRTSPVSHDFCGYDASVLSSGALWGVAQIPRSRPPRSQERQIVSVALFGCAARSVARTANQNSDTRTRARLLRDARPNGFVC